MSSAGVRQILAGSFIVGLAAACSHPDTPTPLPTPLPPGVELFHISGVVTDENGRPRPNVEVVINHYDHFAEDGKPGLPVKVTTARTNGHGRYQMDIQAIRDAYRDAYKVNWIQDIVGFGFATGSPDSPQDSQFFTSSSSAVIRNFRLERYLELAPDQTATVMFRTDATVCSGDASDFLDTLCRFLRVTTPADGALTITSAGSPAAFLQILEAPWPRGSATVTYAVKAGAPSTIALETLPGFTSPRSYTVTTKFQALAR